MPSLLLTSANFDSAEHIAKDLGLPDASWKPDFGLFFCDSQLDAQKTIALVQANAPCPIVGGTSLTLPFKESRDADRSASLLYVQKEGLAFAQAISPPLDPACHREQMESLIASCREKLGHEPSLILAFLPMPSVPMNDFINDIFELAGSVPVFGGTITNDLVATQGAVFASGQALTDRIVIVMLGGSAEPVFSVGSSVSVMSEYAPKVTRSEGTRVFEVDGMPFCDYLRSLGIQPEDRINGVDALMQYGPIPADILRPDRPEDGVPEVRCISCTLVDEGSAVFSGPLPVGARLRMSIISKGNVEHSTQLALSVLKERMAEKQAQGACFDTILCIPCVARYFAVVGDENPEDALLLQDCPAGISLSGFYGLSELGPTLALDDGRVLNRLHSASIIMCAF